MAKLADWRKTGRQTAEGLEARLPPLARRNHLSAPCWKNGRETLVVQFDISSTRSDNTPGSRTASEHFEAARPQLVNVGHRDLFLTAREIAETFETVFSAEEIASDPDRVVAELKAKAESAKRVWIDLDCDAFDPTAMPAVQEPLPFGVAPQAFLKLLNAVWSENVVGLSVSEFDPGRDIRDGGLNLLGWFLEFMLLRVGERKA